MKQSNDKDQVEKKVYARATYPVTFPLEENQENITINTNTLTKSSKEQIINQAFKFHTNGNIPEAIKFYQYFINQGFKDHRVFSNYGVILRNIGRFKEAEISYRKAIELNPDIADTHYNLGIILSDLGRLKEAELSTRKAIEIKPDYAEAHLNLGNILRDLGKLKEAELSTRKAIELNPTLGETYFNLGNILKESSQLNEALYSFKKAQEHKVDKKRCLVGIGKVLLNQGEYYQGIKNIREGEGSIIFDINNGFSKI